jgi:hypothetical protein
MRLVDQGLRFLERHLVLVDHLDDQRRHQQAG